MNRVLKSIATFSLIEAIGRHPVIAGTLMLMGVGGVGAALLTTPAIVPVPTAFFNNGSGAAVNNGLKPNGGSVGAFEVPTVPKNSWGILFDGSISADLGNSGIEYAFGIGAQNFGFSVSNNVNIPTVSLNVAQAGGWWFNPGFYMITGGGASNAGTFGGYFQGYYPWTATAAGCARNPSGTFGAGTSSTFSSAPNITDSGFLCPDSAAGATVDLTTIPGSGARQATGAGGNATTCVTGPVSGEITVTMHVAVPHQIVGGQTYTSQGFTGTGNTGYNATYTSLAGSSGTTLVGETTTGGGTCPANSPATAEGTVFSGTAGSITLGTVNIINGPTGIAVKNNQHFCAALGENGADSPFPGSQFLSMIDDHGNPLQGSPALVPYLNQGATNFIGYLTTGTQSTLGPALARHGAEQLSNHFGFLFGHDRLRDVHDAYGYGSNWCLHGRFRGRPCQGHIHHVGSIWDSNRQQLCRHCRVAVCLQ